MAHRRPELQDLAKLPRDEWEELCAAICSLFFQAHRVEDRRGRGNGMDGWRLASTGVEGFQYRRLDGRLNGAQVSDLRDNIRLATTRCQSEMGKTLSTYHVCLNIDLEPGHKGATGEIERWQRLADWALAAHGVTVVLNGLTWVHSRLLQFPWLRRDLFEDLPGAVAEARVKIEQLSGSTEAMLARLEELICASKADAELKNVLAGLAREAHVHFDRGLERGHEEEFLKAIVSLDDARRLLAMASVDEALRGRVLSLLCGMKVLVGQLQQGLADGEQAVALLDGLAQPEFARIARGNVAMALYRLQRYDEARALCEDLVRVYESEGNLIELVRIVQHLAEMCSNRRDLAAAVMWSERLYIAGSALVELRGGVDSLTISALGTAANVFMTVASTQPAEVERAMLIHAHELLVKVENMAELAKSPSTIIGARAGRAKALWNLDELDHASALYAEVIEQANERGYWKIGCDARFNRAMILAEQGQRQDACAEFLEARRKYGEIGDTPSVEDVDRMMSNLGLR